MSRHPIPAAQATAEIEILKSRFIATVAPIFSVDEAKAFIKKINTKHATASHNVPVFLIGHGKTVIAHSSDNGEPSGTAGRPALAVLKGSGLGDVAVVVTRYYGGTKLGTGGLVRAYGDAVRAVLSVTQRAMKVPTYTTTVTLPYSYFEQVKLLIEMAKGIVLNQIFAANIVLTIQFELTQFDDFQQQLGELSQGELNATIIETNLDTIMPITPITMVE